MPDDVRMAVIGLGSMGSSHARQIAEGRVPGAVLAAVCDRDAQRFAPFPGVRSFTDRGALLRARVADAVVVATPHPDHVSAARAALRAGLHILVEKPLAAHVADAQRLVSDAAGTDRVFAMMFNQRTDPRYRHLRDLLARGALGTIQRIQWTITDWFRTDAYYASSPWRATWAGEGGGVLLNQAPHNLDLWQWLFGMPARVHAFCGWGRYHRIQVEDEVTAHLSYSNGATGVFVTSTGEAPGLNRLEVVGDRGRATVEGAGVTLHRNLTPATLFMRESRERFAQPAVERQDWTFADFGGQHVDILRNFVAAIQGAAPLLAPGGEGVRSLELANAMVLSAWEGRTITLPLDARRYQRRLRARIKASDFSEVTTP